MGFPSMIEKKDASLREKGEEEEDDVEEGGYEFFIVVDFVFVCL